MTACGIMHCQGAVLGTGSRIETLSKIQANQALKIFDSDPESCFDSYTDTTGKKIINFPLHSGSICIGQVFNNEYSR